jgi:DNA invertase Pin-like site-specific DNA recombinase
LESGDTLIVSELCGIGRSVGQIIRTVDALVKGKIRFIAVKEGIWLDEERNIQTQVMVRMFGLLADMDRELVSAHTKEGLAAVRAKGKKLGRPKGSHGRSRLDGRMEEIKRLLSLGVSKVSIAKIMGVERGILSHFIKSRGLAQDP